MKVPAQLMKTLVMAYQLGYADCFDGKEKKTPLQIAASIQAGADKVKRRGV